MRKSKLTEKQKAFVDAYLNSNRNASLAYRTVYGDKDENVVNASSSRLLKNVNVMDYLVKVQQENALTTQRKQDINRDFLIDKYLQVIDLALEERQLSACRQALDSLSHLAGVWTSKTEVHVSGTVDHQLQSLSSEELMQALQQTRKPAIEAEYRNLEQ